MPVVVPMQRANHGAHFRAYGLRGAASVINPYIGIDHAWMSAPTFAPHPHAGFSAVSYLFLDSETGISNRDSTGTNSIILPGGLHWMAAGRGVTHEEVPAESGKTVHALQIFVALPPEQRQAEPFSLSLAPQEVPVTMLAGAKVRVVAGNFGTARSPLKPPTAVTMLDIALQAGSECTVPIAPRQCAFVMPILGTAAIDEQPVSLDDLKTVVYPAQDAPRLIRLMASKGSAKVMVFSGAPFAN